MRDEGAFADGRVNETYRATLCCPLRHVSVRDNSAASSRPKRSGLESVGRAVALGRQHGANAWTWRPRQPLARPPASSLSIAGKPS